MVLGQPSPLFTLAVAQSGSRTLPLRRQEFIVTDDPPKGSITDSIAYSILSEAFGIDDDSFQKQFAIDKLVEDNSFARNVRGTRRIRVATRIFFGLIDQGSLLEI